MAVVQIIVIYVYLAWNYMLLQMCEGKDSSQNYLQIISKYKMHEWNNDSTDLESLTFETARYTFLDLSSILIINLSSLLSLSSRFTQSQAISSLYTFNLASPHNHCLQGLHQEEADDDKITLFLWKLTLWTGY